VIGAALSSRKNLLGIAVKIRPATVDDLPLLAHLWRERLVILEQCDPRFATHETNQDSWMARMFNRLSERDRLILVGEMSDGLAGYISGHITQGRAGLIDDMALDAHRYHGGLGRKLYSAMQSWFTEQDTRQVVIQTPRYHAVEQAFWRAIGAIEWTNDSWETPPELMLMTL
jgi:hypothetical protein